MNPTNPQDCALERDPPASLGCIWAGTIGALLVYVAIIFSIGKSGAIWEAFNHAFSVDPSPVGRARSWLVRRALLWLIPLESTAPRMTQAWLPSKGVIVGSATESYLSTVGRSNMRPVLQSGH